MLGGLQLRYIGLDLKKIFYTNLDPRRKCKEVDKLDEPYTQIQNLQWSDDELGIGKLDGKGKLIHLNDIPKTMTMKLFSIALSDRRIDNLCTNDIDISITTTVAQEESSKRWKVEQFHREIKQTLGIAKCQCRKNRSQRNHIVYCMLSWIYLTKQAIKKCTTIYQIKKQQLNDYMHSVMKHPHWEYEGG